MNSSAFMTVLDGFAALFIFLFGLRLASLVVIYIIKSLVVLDLEEQRA